MTEPTHPYFLFLGALVGRMNREDAFVLECSPTALKETIRLSVGNLCVQAPYDGFLLDAPFYHQVGESVIEQAKSAYPHVHFQAVEIAGDYRRVGLILSLRDLPPEENFAPSPPVYH